MISQSQSATPHAASPTMHLPTMCVPTSVVMPSRLPMARTQGTKPIRSILVPECHPAHVFHISASSFLTTHKTQSTISPKQPILNPKEPIKDTKTNPASAKPTTSHVHLSIIIYFTPMYGCSKGHSYTKHVGWCCFFC